MPLVEVKTADRSTVFGGLNNTLRGAVGSAQTAVRGAGEESLTISMEVTLDLITRGLSIIFKICSRILKMLSAQIVAFLNLCNSIITFSINSLILMAELVLAVSLSLESWVGWLYAVRVHGGHLLAAVVVHGGVEVRIVVLFSLNVKIVHF